MIRIAPYSLWLGNASDGADAAKVCDTGIRAVVQLAIEEPTPALPRELLFFRVPLHDGSDNDPENLWNAVNLVVGLLKSTIPLLVCCSAGASRSPAIVACAMSIVENKPPSTCLAIVREYCVTDVSGALWNDLIACVSSRASARP